MKRLLGFVAASALIALAAPGAVPAASITFTEDTPPGLHKCLSASAPTACNGGAASDLSYTFTLDLNDNGFESGSLITSAELVLHLVDDGGTGEGTEKITLQLDETSVTYTDNANHDAVITLSDFGVLADGLLVVVLGASMGDFFFDGARLTVVDDPPTAAAVPVPGALALLAVGLVGTAWRRRAPR